MASIIVTPEEYASLTISFLLDKMLHPDEVVPDNEEFNDVIKKMKGASMQAYFTKYYIKTSPFDRMQYKRIKDVFDGTTESTQIIKIEPESQEVKRRKEKEKKKKKSGIVKKILKKLIGQGPESLDIGELEILNEMIELMDTTEEENK
jgi:hypothetical protein